MMKASDMLSANEHAISRSSSAAPVPVWVDGKLKRVIITSGKKGPEIVWVNAVEVEEE